MADEPVFARATGKTHMPFFDGRILLFCQAGATTEYDFRLGGSIWRRLAENPALRARFARLPRTSRLRYRAWKLTWCYWDDRRPRPIATGLPPAAVECSPALYRDEHGYHLSFVGGVPGESGLVYHLYAMSGPSLDALAPPVVAASAPTRIGFVGPGLIATGRRSELHLVDRSTGCQQLLRPPLAELYRASFRADAPEQLLLTGRNRRGDYLTLLYDLQHGLSREVRTEGRVYKATVFGDRVVFARRDTDEFEDRQLYHGRLGLVPLATRVRRRFLPPGATAWNPSGRIHRGTERR